MAIIIIARTIISPAFSVFFAQLRFPSHSVSVNIEWNERLTYELFIKRFDRGRRGMVLMPDQAMNAILIVEDDAGVAGPQKGRLEQAGFKALVADSADAALSMLRGQSVNLILLNHK